MEKAIAIANYFIKKSIDTGTELTPLKLLKLVYLSHGWNLGIKNDPLISEAVQAWKYGPVVTSVYHDFKPYKDSQITELKTETNFILEPAFRVEVSIPICDDNEQIKLLDKVWEVYSKYSGVELSALTHEKGSPWDIVWNEQGGSQRKSAIIPNDLIRDFYKRKAGN